MSIWFAMRGTGIVLTALLTLSVAIGVLSTVRTSTTRWPRFATQALHRNVSLLAVTFLTLHALFAVIHEFVDIRWYDIFLPVGGRYVTETEPVAMTLAALATDLSLAVVITSLLRARMPHRTWRGIHLLSYAAWAAGVTHGILAGTDAATWWGLGTTVVSVGVVALSVGVRVWTATHEARREAVTTGGW